MNQYNQDSFPKIPSDLRLGDVVRGKMLGNDLPQMQKIVSGEDIILNFDVSITQKSKSQDLNDYVSKQGEFTFEVSTYRGNEEQFENQSSLPIKQHNVTTINESLIEKENHSNIHDDCIRNLRSKRNSSILNALQSKDDLYPKKTQMSNLNNEIEDSPRFDQFGSKAMIQFNQFDLDLRQSPVESLYIKKENIMRPIGSAAKIVSEKSLSIARSASVKKKLEKLNDVWKTRGLFILFYVRRFIVYLKNISSDNKFRSLSRPQFNIIDDRSSSFNFYKYGNFLVSSNPSYFERQLFDIRQKIQKSVCFNSRLITFISDNIIENFITINPESLFKLVWDGFMLFLLVINIFYIPLKIAFEDSGGLKWPQILVFFLNDVPGWAFLMDILMSCNTAFYKKGVIITNKSAIFKQYIKNQFFWDLFVLIPFIVSQYFSIKYLDAILLLRFNKIMKITTNYLDLLNLRNEQAAFCDLIKLIILILFIAHFCGCAFYYVSYLEVQSGIDTNWLNHLYKIENAHSQDWFTNYVTSFYWAVITMITVGYGDITPSTTYERIFCIVICLMSCGVFAYSVNSIGYIIGAMTQKATNFKQKMSLLSIHMKKRGLNKDLQMKVKKYFEYLNDERLEDNQEGENMLKELAGSLKNEIALDIYGKILNSKKLFKLNFSQAFLLDLAPKLKEKRLGPEEIIYNEQECHPRLYFVMKGNKSQQNSFKVLQTISKGGVFGELGFFSGMASNHGAITTNVVSLVYINIEDFLEVIQQHKIDHEKFSLIKDNYLLYSSSRGLGTQCWGCGQYTHQINHCPLLNYVPNKDQIIQKYRKLDVSQIRQTFKRERFKSAHPWFSCDGLKQAVVQLIVEIEKITDLEDLYLRIEEMELSEEESDQEDERQNIASEKHIMFKESPTAIQIQNLENIQEKNSEAELLHRIIRKGNRQKTYRKNSYHIQSKPSLGLGQDKRMQPIIKRPSEIIEDSLGLTSSKQDSPYEDPQSNAFGSFKDIRSSIKRATFIKKISTKKSVKDSPTLDEDHLMLSPEERKRKAKKNGLFIKTIGISNLNGASNFAPVSKENPPLKENIDTEKMKIENEINTRLYSKIVEFDVCKEYKKYYPKNNFINTINSYNNSIKLIKKNGSQSSDLYKESPNKKKSVFKSIINKNSNLLSKYNTILNNNVNSPLASSNRMLKKQSGQVNLANSIDAKINLKKSKFNIEHQLNNDDN